MRDLLTYYWVKNGQPQSRLDFNNALTASKAPRSDQYQLRFSHQKNTEFNLL